MKTQDQKKTRSSYAKRFNLPIAAFPVLQKAGLLPKTLPVLELLPDADRLFLDRYSKAWCIRDVVAGGAALYTYGERKKLTLAVQEKRPEWQEYVSKEYEHLYNIGAFDMREETRGICKELSAKYEMTINSKVRREINRLRRAAKLRANRKNERFFEEEI